MKSKDTVRRFWYFVMRPLLRLVAWTVFRVKLNRKNYIKGQHLVLSNHSSIIDAVLVSSMFKSPIYFVAASINAKAKFWGKLLQVLTGVIPIDKTGFDIKAIRAVLKTKAEGKSIGIFPEGNNSISGAPLYFGIGIAKLAKQLKIPVALCNIRGGYFTHPKWATFRRNGEVTGKIVRILTVEEVAQLSNEELYIIIREALYIDAYKIQDEEKKVYPHKQLSRGIESLFYYCSECGAEGKIVSFDDHFECKNCGAKMRYNEYGYIEGSRFTTTRDWDNWQIQKVYEKVKSAKDNEPIYTVADYELFDFTGKERISVAKGDFIIYKDKITIGEFSLPISEIEGTALHIINCVLITTKRRINYIARQENPLISGLHMWYAIDAARGVVSQNISGLVRED